MALNLGKCGFVAYAIYIHFTLQGVAKVLNHYAVIDVLSILQYHKGMAQRIITNPKILAGKPIIKGTRIPVYLILNLLANGYTHERVVKAYPRLKKQDVIAALEYAQSLTKREERFSVSRIAFA